MARSHPPTATPVTELDPPEPLVNQDPDALTGHRRHGTRGAAPEHEPLDDELRRKGVYYDSEHVTVLDADTFGRTHDGSLNGEVCIQHSPFDDPTVVPYTDVALPSKVSLRRLSPTLTTSVPSYYDEEIARKEAIINACPIDVYCASINPELKQMSNTLFN
jgi:hypothetical protein